MADRTSSPGPLKYRLWCGGLHRDIEEDEVRKHMERYGEVVSVMIRSSPKDTFAFIQFNNKKACDDAIDDMDGNSPSDLGEKVRVALSTPDNKSGGQRPPPRRQEPDRRDDSRSRPPPPPPRMARDFRDDRRGGSRGDDFRGGRRGGDFRDDSYRRGRDDSRDFQRGGSRCDRRGSRNGDRYSPPPPPPRDGYRRGGGRYDEPPRRRSRSRSDRGEGAHRWAGKVPVGRYKITIENLPDDMSWSELKDLGREYGSSLTFSRTYRHRGQYYGMLEFSDRAEADYAIKELDGRRVQGAKDRLRAFLGPGPGGD